jgi:hypothetical protein
VYITGIRFRKHGTKEVQGWRLSAGVGKMRPVVTISGTDKELEGLTYALKFALSGKRSENLEEVWLDAADDAGDVWTIERGAKGSIFRRNSRLLSIEEAQRSLLASLLDLDASLSSNEGLVAPLELRQIISRGAEVAATKWDPAIRNGRADVAGLTAAKELAAICSQKLNLTEYSDPYRIAQIAGPASRLLGAYLELKGQAAQLGKISDQSVKGDQGFEAMQVEVDILNQIDQLIRRVNGGGESFARLSKMHESFDARVLAIEAKWTKAILTAVNELPDSGQYLDQLVRIRAWGRFIDNLNRVTSIMDQQVRPINSQGVKVWSEFLAGARSNGQDIESCLASMLLGVKQMALEVDRYASQASPQSATPSTMPLTTPSTMPLTMPQVVHSKSPSWFERFKSGSTKVVDERFKEAAPALKHQRDWIARLAREVEAVKISAEFALQSSQTLTDVVGEANARLEKDSSALSHLLSKAVGEHDRLKVDWSKIAAELGISESIGIKQFSGLLRDATEYLIMMHSREDLAMRVADRQEVQDSLESHVRKWWGIIGSQKSVDISNVSLLIVEAKATLRYREGRRNRIQKGLDESSRVMGARSTGLWVASRMDELIREWNQLFNLAGLPPLDLLSDSVRDVVELSQRCASLLEIVRIEEHEQFAAASLWPARLDSVVIVYRWSDTNIPTDLKSGFVNALNSFVGDGGVPVLLLVSDPELAGILARSGTGVATAITLDSVAEVDGPRREGAAGRSESRVKRQGPPSNPNTPSTSGAPAAGKSQNIIKGTESATRSLLNPRAEAALRVLNPRPSK